MRGNAKAHMYSYVGHIFCIYCQKHENFVEIEIFEHKPEHINLVNHQVPFWLKNRPATEAPPSAEFGAPNLQCKYSLTQ